VVSQFDSLRGGDGQGAKGADVKLAIGSASPRLVRRQAVTIACGGEMIVSGEFGPNGGPLGAVAPTVPADVRITLTVDFLPETNLPTFVRVYDRKLTSTGLVGVVQIFSDDSSFFVDWSPYGQFGDFLLGTLRVRPSSQKKTVVTCRPLSAARRYGIESRDAEFVYLADEEPQALSFEISGRLQGCAPGWLGSVSKKQMENADLVRVVWNCSTGRPEFHAVK
jgi:hypothetical protein